MAEAKVKKPPVGFMVLPVNSPRAKVSECPTTVNSPEEQKHKNRKIYSTQGNVRFCKCDDCGQTWKMILDPADDWTKFLSDLAKSFEESPTSIIDGQDSIVMSKADADQIAGRLMEIVTAK